MVVGADDGRLVAYDLRSTAAPVSHVDAHDGAVRSLQFVDAAPPRPRIAASPARARGHAAAPSRRRAQATPPRQATPKATPPRSPVASPRRVVDAAAAARDARGAAAAAVAGAPLPREAAEIAGQGARGRLARTGTARVLRGPRRRRGRARASIQNLARRRAAPVPDPEVEVAALLEAHENSGSRSCARNAGLRRENEERLPW